MRLTSQLRESLTHLLELVQGDGVGEVEVEKRSFGGWRIRVSKAKADPGFVPAALTPASEPAPVQEGGDPDRAPERAAGHHEVPSPMVGTFYRAPSPDAEPFVKEGDVVSPGQTLCIIEAMKILNEIEAEINGRVDRVLVENGTPVEYGTPLFLIEPL